MDEIEHDVVPAAHGLQNGGGAADDQVPGIAQPHIGAVGEAGQAHQWTDEELERLERRISRVYREAWDDLEKTVIDYFNRFIERDEEMRKLIGTGINGKVWTERDYELWRLNQIGRGERFDDLAVKVAERYTKANEVALAYVNDATPGIYSLNRNYVAYTIEKVAGNVGFTLWDESTVRRLIVEEPDLMPYYPKEKASSGALT